MIRQSFVPLPKTIIMNKTTAILKLKMSKEAAASFGVSKIGLFGSTVRQDENENSDVDVLIDFADGKETFANFISICDLLEKNFAGTKVDVVTMKGLSPFIERQILREVEYV